MDPKLSPHGLKSESYAPVRMGVMGAIVANHPLAAGAGMRVLQMGGNAVDAAVAVGFALGVAEPAGSTIGGDGFVMVHMSGRGHQKAAVNGAVRPAPRPSPSQGEGPRTPHPSPLPQGERGQGRPLIEVANGTGAAPLAATPERFKRGIEPHHATAISVPGILDALLSAHERFGLLPLADCVVPAIELCEEGVPVTYYSHLNAAPHPRLNTFKYSAPIFASKGHSLRPGEVRRNPDLARTYRVIAEQGRRAFYEGEVAEEIVRFSKENGGLLTMEDLRRHRVRWDKPISTSYRGRTVYEAPPNSSGHVLLQMFAALEGFDIAGSGHNTPESIHLMAEAKRLAFADREMYLADPEYVDVPIEGLLSRDYARDRAKLISRTKAAKEVVEGDPWAYMARSPDRSKTHYRRGVGIVRPGSAHPLTPSLTGRGGKETDTTHFCIVDRWGNAVGELQSIQTAYGSGLVAGRTGILMNNRMTYWHLDEDHIDRLRPGQRVRHTMNPVMAFSAPIEVGGKLEMVWGTPGADTQVQSNLQVGSAVFDHGYTVAEALHAARWTHHQGRTASNYPHAERNALEIEQRLPPATLDALRSMGHNVEGVGPWAGPGSEGAIQVHQESGALMAAGDPRRDGHALVW